MVWAAGWAGLRNRHTSPSWARSSAFSSSSWPSQLHGDSSYGDECRRLFQLLSVAREFSWSPVATLRPRDTLKGLQLLNYRDFSRATSVPL